MRTKQLLFPLLLLALLTATIGIYLPHHISKQHNFVGIVADHIYTDNSSNKTLSNKDIQTCYSLLTHGGNGLAAVGSLLTQRMSIINTRDLESGDCGACSAKLYTYFNIRYIRANAHRNCEA